MIAAMEAGADVYLQKPISRDVLEGEAMVAAARKHKQVVQVGTQRKHAASARSEEERHRGRAARQDRAGRSLLLLPYAGERQPAGQRGARVFRLRDVDRPGAAAALRQPPTRPLVADFHGVWQRNRGRHVRTHARSHAARCSASAGRSGSRRAAASSSSRVANRTSATRKRPLFEYDDLNVTWQHRTWGKAADPKYPWSAIFYGDKGTLKASTDSYDFVPEGSGKPIHKDAVLERNKYPEEATEKDMDWSGDPCTRANLKNFLECIETRGRPVSDIEVAHISTASCILANVSMQLGRAIVYDPAKRQVVGDEEATKLLKRPYRGSWKHPGETLA